MMNSVLVLILELCYSSPSPIEADNNNNNATRMTRRLRRTRVMEAILVMI